jgi:5'-deoxynucleotidase YfbR-like HD superfamily hydrolase
VNNVHGNKFIGDNDLIGSFVTAAATPSQVMRDRLLFLRRGLGVRRYHQRYTSVIDTVGKHSAGVAGMILLLYGEKTPPGHVLAQAIVHDLPECVTGDIPSPAKRAMGLAAKEELDNKEWELLHDHRFVYPCTEAEERLLKLADYLDGLAFCWEEFRRGNKEVDEVGDVYLSYINRIVDNSDEQEAEVVFAVTRLWSLRHDK